MIKKLKIRNFKCFNNIALPLTPLTLLTGLNAAGKSTTLQSLLLLAQSLRSEDISSHLSLNGPLTHLGTPGEILKSGSSHISFSIASDNESIEWTLTSEDRTQGLTMQVTAITIKDGDTTNEYATITKLEKLLPEGISQRVKEIVDCLSKTIFLSAVRTSTNDVFPSPEIPKPVHADVGLEGEFAPWWFYQYLDEDIEDIRCNPIDEAKTLRRQLNAWASTIFPSAQANVLKIEKTSLMRLELRIGETGDWRRPSNIGYGLTYAFPILVAGLLAKPGQILIIDSPEAHLHPKGQSQMGYFLATIAAAGVQILIETHSDHLLNGIRLAIGKKKILEPKDATVYFFDGAEPAPSNLRFTVTGGIDNWPIGFFDQYQTDITSLTQVRRPRPK